jgi:hypothetical protein
MLAQEWSGLTESALNTVLPPPGPASSVRGPPAKLLLQDILGVDLGATTTEIRVPAVFNFQREAARETVTEFVHKWLITQDRWKAVRASSIHVLFEDEPISRLTEVATMAGAIYTERTVPFRASP